MPLVEVQKNAKTHCSALSWIPIIAKTAMDAKQRPPCVSPFMPVLHLLFAIEKGVSINELHRKLGVTYKTAWLMAQRLRQALAGRELRSVRDSDEGSSSAKTASAKSPKAGRSKAPSVPTRTMKMMFILLAQDKQSSEKKRSGVPSEGRDGESKRRDP